MPTEYHVQQGECISSIAAKYGFFPESIWNDSANANLKEKRTDPNILFPGDVVVVPDKHVKFLDGATETRHKFRRKGVPEVLRIVLKDDQGMPRKALEYHIIVDGVHYVGKTDDGGLIRVQIPLDAHEARLSVGPEDDREEYVLDLGHLDPISEVSGVQMRLQNLGFFSGSPNGMLCEATLAAIREFQESTGLPITGDLDQMTREKLEERHGS